MSRSDVREVFCRASCVLHRLDVEDHDVLVLGLANGACATFELGYVCPGSLYDTFVSVCTDKLFLSTPRYDKGTIVFRDGREQSIGDHE